MFIQYLYVHILQTGTAIIDHINIAKTSSYYLSCQYSQNKPQTNVSFLGV